MTEQTQLPPIRFDYDNVVPDGPNKHNWAIEGVGIVITCVSELLLDRDEGYTMSSTAKCGVNLILETCAKQLEWVCEQNRLEAKSKHDVSAPQVVKKLATK